MWLAIATINDILTYIFKELFYFIKSELLAQWQTVNAFALCLHVWDSSPDASDENNILLSNRKAHKGRFSGFWLAILLFFIVQIMDMLYVKNVLLPYLLAAVIFMLQSIFTSKPRTQLCGVLMQRGLQKLANSVSASLINHNFRL